MPSEIVRNQVNRGLTQVNLTAALGTTPDIPFEGFAGGTIFIPAGSSITTLTFYGAPRQPGEQTAIPSDAVTYYPMHTNDGNNTAVSLTVTAGNCYALPADVFALASLKIVVNIAGQVELSLKS